MLRRLIGEDVGLVIDLDGTLASVSADAGQLEQTIINLAVNAREAMPDGGTFTICTRNVLVSRPEASRLGLQPGTYVRLSAEDTAAIGMDEHQAARVRSVLHDESAGHRTGPVDRVRHRHPERGSGGRREPAGRGLGLSVFLPAVSATPRDPAEPPPSADLDGGSETCCSSRTRRSFAILRAGSFATAATASSRRARRGGAAPGRRACGPDRPLLTDVMPGMNGRELADRLVEIRPGTRVIFMSGYTEDVILQRGVSGDRAFLAKPFTPPMLARSVREALDAPARAAS